MSSTELDEEAARIAISMTENPEYAKLASRIIISNIKQILGLKQDREYKNTNDLRYGHVMILTDADTDGSHIKALFVNFIHAYWPSLLKISIILPPLKLYTLIVSSSVISITSIK